jgi:hypothetical protein
LENICTFAIELKIGDSQIKKYKNFAYENNSADNALKNNDILEKR